ncbi:endonuclease domain-containing protein [Catalinimonas niigatensis]|uniref:endonuclease domain-containing protein n=1 Tax=Catalinimonas niigatensis TaxID=1397264 RepID=UPI0026668A76|nr:endonuclease domain-containing protein [Catalinimonas niigatensis]WPP49043.1 endonuclease domain-containing protein [Catalinimonas niigatensis]
MPRHPYYAWLKPYARRLRNHSTPGEIRLWCEVLRARKFYGYQFNRQLSIGRYIADFACRKLSLVVELDGKSHQYKVEEDRIRDEFMQSLGYRVVRIAESEVMNNLDNVIRTLESYLPENKSE